MDGTRSLLISNEIMLYGAISPDVWEGSEIRAIDVVASLANVTGDVVSVRINSPGGSVNEAIAIYNALRADRRKIVCYIDSIAASAASLIAMAGDEIVMAENASIMVHDPFAFVGGNGDDLRAYADEIDRMRAIVVDIYAKRTKRSADEISHLMSAETFMGAEEAVRLGFADRVEEALAVAACATLDKDKLRNLLFASMTKSGAKAPVPAAPAAHKPEAKLADENASAGVDPAPTPAPAIDVQAAVKAERKRIGEIQASLKAAKLPTDDDFANGLVNSSMSAESAKAKILDAFVEKNRADGNDLEIKPSAIAIVADARDRFAQGVELALMARAGMAGGQRNEFSGLTLREVARESLRIVNAQVPNDPMQMIGAAFTIRMDSIGHSTSDFANILANVANKGMLNGWGESPETFDRWTAKGSLTDFKPVRRVDLNLFDELATVDEGAEYTFGSIGDRGETIQLATYGKKFAITRQAIINDDMSMFTRIPMRMGQAAKRTIGSLVFSIFTNNPVMSDSVALFHATHNNLATGGGSALSVTSLDTARVAMAKQKDPDSKNKTGLNIRPSYLLVPVALQGTAEQLMKSITEPGQANPNVINKVANMAEIIPDARFDAASATAWYLAANPNQYDTIEVAYLNGVDTPYMEQQNGWDVDGVEFKVRIDAGVKALDFRGLYKGNGA